jgi:hypothetical protein
MRRHLYLNYFIVLGALSIWATVSHAGTIAHWSFDAADITTDGSGNILTAADSSGNHNATTVIGGTGASITTATGQFGAAASFVNLANNVNQATNNAWMSFPQLTEIAGPTGGSFTVAAWVNGANTTGNNTVLADWGNAAANTNRFTYWFDLSNVDSATRNRPRGQLRAANSPIAPTNIDIISQTVSNGPAGTPPNNSGIINVMDSTWHHVAWVWDKPNKTLKIYIDGLEALSAVSGQSGSNLDILPSASNVGAIGRKGDNNRYFSGLMDELWVTNFAMSPAEVNGLRTANLIPEPSAVWLVALAIIGLHVRRHKRNCWV